MRDRAHAFPKNYQLDSALRARIRGARTREGSDGRRRKRKRGSRANRRDKKPMHVLLPAVRRLQSDDRFYGARLTDVNPGSSVGSSTR